MEQNEFSFEEQEYGFDVLRLGKAVGSMITISGDWIFVPYFEFRYGTKTGRRIDNEFRNWAARRDSNPRHTD